MELTPAQYERIAHCFPKPRGKLVYSNLEALNAIIYVAENGIKWRRLPKYYGNWHTIYTRMRGWAKAGVLARAFAALQEEQIVDLKLTAGSLDSTLIKVHPDGTGALKKTAHSPSEDPEEDLRPRFICLPAMSAQRYVSPCLQDSVATGQKAVNS